MKQSYSVSTFDTGFIYQDFILLKLVIIIVFKHYITPYFTSFCDLSPNDFTSFGALSRLSFWPFLDNNDFTSFC